MKTKVLNDEVIMAQEPFVSATAADVASLKKMAVANKRRRARLCAHTDVQDKLHEMVIVLAKGVYIRPHQHVDKAESFQVLEGEADAVFFNDEGKITEVLRMGRYDSDRTFYYRLAQPVYHTLILRTEFLVFHESTTGPLDRSKTRYAPWAPEDTDTANAAKFMTELEKKVNAWSK